MNTLVKSELNRSLAAAPAQDVYIAAQLTTAERKRIERLAKSGVFVRVYKGLYVNADGNAPGIEIRNGAGFLAGDMPLSHSGLHYSGRTRSLLENLGRKSSIRAGQEEVERRLISTLNSSGENALNAIRDEAASLTQSLGCEDEAATLRRLIGELLGTHQRGELKTAEGIQVAMGKPVDK